MKKALLVIVLVAGAGSTGVAAPQPGDGSLSAAVAQGRNIARPTAQAAAAAIDRAIGALGRLDKITSSNDGCKEGEQRGADCDAYFSLYFTWLAQAVQTSRKAVAILPKLTVADLTLARSAYDQLEKALDGYKLGNEEKFLNAAERTTYRTMIVELDNIEGTLKRTLAQVESH